jgi:DNA replication protein DnaC
MRPDISPELKQALKSLRLGQLLPTLPERLRIARERKLDPEDVLLTLLTDETQRRAQQRHRARAREGGLHPDLVFERWDPAAKITFDRRVLEELRLFRFVDEHHHALIVGPVGVGKTMLAHDAIVCGRHRKASMIVTSNRDPSEWLALLADPLQAQALVDRFVNSAYDLVIEGESYRRRQKPNVGGKA